MTIHPSFLGISPPAIVRPFVVPYVCLLTLTTLAQLP